MPVSMLCITSNFISMHRQSAPALFPTTPLLPGAAVRSRAWLEFWRSEAGLEGFYPFVLMAAAYMRNPAPFTCERVKT